MRARLLALLVALLAGCQETSVPHEAVLTLVPTSMRVVGLAAPGAGYEQTLCLIAGASVEANIYVSRSPFTVVIDAFTPTPMESPWFELHVGSGLIAVEALHNVPPRAMVYTAHAERGEQLLRVNVPGTSPGVLCLQQVIVSQP
jgi:hypothetical protein